MNIESSLQAKGKLKICLKQMIKNGNRIRDKCSFLQSIVSMKGATDSSLEGGRGKYGRVQQKSSKIY